MTNSFSAVIAVAVACALTACATAHYYPYESRSNVHNGKGGTKVVVDGTEIWFNGDPPRKYAILGYIEDSRTGSVLDHEDVPPSVLKKAREVGAEALIEVVQQSSVNNSVITGGTIFGGGSTGFGIGIGMPVSPRTDVKYIAIDYLD